MDYSLLRELPNMNRLLEHPLLLGENRTLVKLAARKLLDELRTDILAGKRDTLPSPDQCASLVLEKMKTDRKPSLRGVVNATGIVLHTNLPEKVRRRMEKIAPIRWIDVAATPISRVCSAASRGRRPPWW